MKFYSAGLKGFILTVSLFVLVFGVASCSKKQGGGTGEDPQVTSLGSIEVTAKLAQIRGELIDDPMYDYAHVMTYKVLKVHRGKVDSEFIYVGHYNPAKPRSKAADA